VHPLFLGKSDANKKRGEREREAQRPHTRKDDIKSKRECACEEKQWDKRQSHKRAHGHTADTREDDTEEDPILLHTR
jgi:hypothetical protein